MIYYILFKTIVVSFALSSLAYFIGDLILTINETINKYWLKISLYFISYMLTCNKCFSFWLSLIISQDILVAALTSIVISTITYIINTFKLIETYD